MILLIKEGNFHYLFYRGLKNVIENNRWKEIRFENYFENYKDLTE